MAQRSFGQRIGQLALSLVNATLLLAVLLLWMAWSVLSAAERVSSQFSNAAATALPLRSDIIALTDEVTAARADLAQLRATGEQDSAALAMRLGAVEAQLTELTAFVEGLGAEPGQLIEEAVTKAFDRLGVIIASILQSLRGAPALST